jgi:hypothetical protein
MLDGSCWSRCDTRQGLAEMGLCGLFVFLLWVALIDASCVRRLCDIFSLDE